MADVVLIYFHNKDDLVHIPMGLLYIGTYLTHTGFKVKIHNYIKDNNEGLTEEEFRNLKGDLKDATCIGFSVLTTQVQRSLELSKKVKTTLPKLSIVWGGVHPTLFPKSTCSNSNIDFVVINEGEEPLIELVKHLKSKNKNFKDIPNLVFKKNNKVIINKEGKLLKFENSPIPDWRLLDDFVKKNIIYHFQGIAYKFVEIHTGRGCPYRCTFCLNAILFGKSRRSRSPESIIKEIKLLKKNYNVNLIKFRDENFFINKEFLNELCNDILKENLNIKWWTTARANYFDKFDDQFLQKLKKSGCFHLLIGAESGSSKILKAIKKDITPEQLISCAEKCIKHGIVPNFSFMVGFPDENLEDIKATINLMVKLKSISNDVAITGPHLLRPYPGGELYETLRDKFGDYLKDKSLEEWATSEKLFNIFLKPSDLPWIKDPELIEIVVEYTSRMFNSLSKAPLWVRLFADLKSKLYKIGIYSYLYSKNKFTRNLAKNYLKALDSIKKRSRVYVKDYIN
ncbi:MAG: radical SAM protein [archaeon]